MMHFRRRLSHYFRGPKFDQAHQAKALFRSYYLAVKYFFYCLFLRYGLGKNVLGVVLIEHMGDIAAAEPISRKIKSGRRDHIVWFARKEFCGLLRHNDRIDKIQTVGCLTETYALYRRNIFNRMFMLHHQGRVCPRCRKELDKKENPRITVENYYDHGSLLRGYCISGGLEPSDDAPRVYISAAEKRLVSSLGLRSPYIVIHCLTNEESRNWTKEGWLCLLKELSDRNINVVEIGAKALAPQQPGSQYYDLCGKLTMLESAEVIRRAKLFVGVDSGPAHLANAAGIPGVIILGSYRAFKKYNPYSGFYGGGGAALLNHHQKTAGEIGCQEVLAAVLQKYHE